MSHSDNFEQYALCFFPKDKVKIVGFTLKLFIAETSPHFDFPPQKKNNQPAFFDCRLVERLNVKYHSSPQKTVVQDCCPPHDPSVIILEM